MTWYSRIPTCFHHITSSFKNLSSNLNSYGSPMKFAPQSKDLNSLSDLRSREVKAILTDVERRACFFNGHLRWTCVFTNFLATHSTTLSYQSNESMNNCFCVSVIQCRSLKNNFKVNSIERRAYA